MVQDRPSQNDRPPITHTGADETSETRFGPRPVPEGHRHPAGPSESRRIPPHGDVSPDGSRVWPRPSPTAKWLVWGGTALAAAAVTAGTVIVARQLLDAATGPRRRTDPERSMAPRFADLTPEERAAMRRRVRDRDDENARHLARLRAEASLEAGVAADAAHARPRRHPAPRPAPRPSLMQEVEANTASLQNGLENVMQALDTAVSGFRTVAGQTSGILREFDGAAGLIRGLFGGGQAAPTCCPQKSRHHAGDEPPMPDLRDDPLTHDPLDGPDEAEGPADHNPRLHRL